MDGFRQRVITIVRNIPAGQVMTYGQVALLAGNPQAARAVGGILRNAPNALDLPWQRVINAQGGISTYKIGSGELQRALLEHEGVVVHDDRVDLTRYRWEPDDEIAERVRGPRAGRDAEGGA